MKKYITFLICASFIGLAIVAGEVEGVKTGYRIRQLNIRKLHLSHENQDLEYQVASLKTPRYLEEQMHQYRVALVHSERLELASLTRSQDISIAESNQKAWQRFSSLLLGEAQAKTKY